MWRPRWWVPDGRHGDQPHPPLLLVCNRVGPCNTDIVIAQMAELTQRHWQGTACDGFHMYDGKLPIVVTGMNQLKEHGPAGTVLRCFGRPDNQTLLEAIGNARRVAHDARQQAEYAARERECKEQPRCVAEQQPAEREARRPACAGCGTRFTDERWKAVEPAEWDAPRENHPHLCDDCQPVLNGECGVVIGGRRSPRQRGLSPPLVLLRSVSWKALRAGGRWGSPVPSVFTHPSGSHGWPPACMGGGAYGRVLTYRTPRPYLV
ncbi:hypothetical protein [Streptomyces hawaiiensis]|uniref:hypothetical protein n=1 Tax=Streptomyces hawaiiensis TaxID=67305 RepID=UPI003655D96D